MGNLIFQTNAMPGQLSTSICWACFAKFKDYVSRFICSNGKKLQLPFDEHIPLNNSMRLISFFKSPFYRGGT